MRQIPYGATLALVGALALWGCGGGGGGSSTPTSPTTATPPPAPTPTPTPTPPAGPNTVTVSIVGANGINAFSPNPIRANAGDTVVFRNIDSLMHRIVVDGANGDLADVNPGATSRAFTVPSASPLNFRCSIHNTMVGSINGTPPEPPPCIPDSYGYGC